MNREIKFKFWLGHTKKMTHEHSLIDIAHLHWDFTEDIIPLQFTGLKDKNGVEIYESDIVSLKTNYLKNAKPFEESDISEHIYTVKFFDGMFALARGLPFNNGFVTEGEMEVIGNIYENPELL